MAQLAVPQSAAQPVARKRGGRAPRAEQAPREGQAPREAREPLGSLVGDPKEPLRLRELAVQALGELAVKREDASAGKVGLVFPVRRAAAEAIRKLEKAGVLLPSYVTQAEKQVKWEAPLPEAGRK